MSRELTQAELDYRRCPDCGSDDLELATLDEYLCHGCRVITPQDELVVVDEPRRGIDA